MIVFINSQGELTCSGLGISTSVSDMINAVLDFCEKHVDCAACRQTCCAGLTVYPDHIFLDRLLQLSRHSLSDQDLAALPTRLLRFDKDAGKWFLPQSDDGCCKFLSRTNRCTIYEARPLVCRLHICGKIESGFKQVKNNIYFAYQDALRLEMTRWLQPEPSSAANVWRTANPALSVASYNVPVAAIQSWIQG
jgi:Fe-S-cluster containining protein